MSEKNTTLKLNSSLNELNAIIENSKFSKRWYKEKMSDNNKTLIMSKNALQFLQENGVKLEKNYISYNNTPRLYTAIYTILQENSDIFSKRENA